MAQLTHHVDGFETIYYVDSQVGIQHNKLVTFLWYFNLSIN